LKAGTLIACKRSCLTLDRINRAHGPGALQYAAEGLEKPWLSRKKSLSSAGLEASNACPAISVDAPRPLLGFVHPVQG